MLLSDQIPSCFFSSRNDGLEEVPFKIESCCSVSVEALIKICCCFPSRNDCLQEAKVNTEGCYCFSFPYNGVHEAV